MGKLKLFNAIINNFGKHDLENYSWAKMGSDFIKLHKIMVYTVEINIWVYLSSSWDTRKKSQGRDK